MTEKEYQPKEFIFREGDPSDAAYVIRSGKVEILKHAAHGEVQLAVLSEGQTFGEMGVLFEPQSPRSATARAIDPTVVDIIDDAELKSMLKQCPERFIPIIMAVFDRLRVTNQRVTNSEQATVILDTEIEKIIVSPASDAIQQSNKPMEVLTARLPFKIGGYIAANGINRADQNHMNILTDGPPQIISRQHCQISIEENAIYLVDMGSRFGTYVNGKGIGRGRGVYKAPLQKGKNKVTLGSIASPYTLELDCI